ncbi:MAG TPA: DUF6134 family protein [Geminicoccaceae bacterium]|nr:DUF6134 family protein [Geminicoccaceae bacterium]
MVKTVVSLLTLLIWCNPALACALPEGRAVYRVEHETFGDIGRQVLTFRCSGDQLLVDTAVHVAVRVLFVTLYRYEARYHEVWQGDRLVRFESHTDDNGRTLEVRARAEAGRMVIDGPEGHSEAPLSVVPDHPWNREMVDHTLLFDPTVGTLRRVQVTEAGQAPVEVDGRRIMGRKYRVSGDLDLELWYDARGAWLKWRMRREEGAVTMTRQLPSAQADAGQA